MGEVYMPDFVLCWDESQEQYYAFRSQTGETIYGASENGDITGLDRNLSAWRRPGEDQPFALHDIPVFTCDPKQVDWGRQRPMTLNQAEALYSKHYDFAAGFFFWVQRADGATLWSKPQGVPATMPCADLDQPLVATVDAVNGEVVEAQGGTAQEGIHGDGDVALEGGAGGDLPWPWQVLWDDVGGAEYYYNDETGEATYEKPEVSEEWQQQLEGESNDAVVDPAFDAYPNYGEGVDAYDNTGGGDYSGGAVVEEGVGGDGGYDEGMFDEGYPGGDNEEGTPSALVLYPETAELAAVPTTPSGSTTTGGGGGMFPPLHPAQEAREKQLELLRAGNPKDKNAGRSNVSSRGSNRSASGQVLELPRDGDVSVQPWKRRATKVGRLHGGAYQPLYSTAVVAPKTDANDNEHFPLPPLETHGRTTPYPYQSRDWYATEESDSHAREAESTTALLAAARLVAAADDAEALARGESRPGSKAGPSSRGGSRNGSRNGSRGGGSGVSRGVSRGGAGASRGGSLGGHSRMSSRFGSRMGSRMGGRVEDNGSDWVTARPPLPVVTTRMLKPPPAFKYLDQESILNGPYIRRSGVGRHMTTAIHKLPAHAPPSERVALAQGRGDRAFLGPEDVNYEEWALGEKVMGVDGRVMRESTLEPMTLCRAAFVDGAEAIVDVMVAFHHRPDVQIFGLHNLAKLDYPEEGDTGFAHPGGLVALDYVLHVLPAYKANETIQGAALNVLAVLADNFSLRREMFKLDWVTPMVAAVMACESDEFEMWVDHASGQREKKIFKRPTRQAAETCAWACKLIAQMACDNNHRARVADDGVALALHALKFAGDENALVAMNACRAIYNCVYRCEAAHVMATEEDALALVEPLLETYSGDDDVERAANRTVRSLQPDGWRGAADDTGSIIGGQPEGEGANQELAESNGGADELTEWSVDAYVENNDGD